MTTPNDTKSIAVSLERDEKSGGYIVRALDNE